MSNQRSSEEKMVEINEKKEELISEWEKQQIKKQKTERTRGGAERRKDGRNDDECMDDLMARETNFMMSLTKSSFMTL